MLRVQGLDEFRRAVQSVDLEAAKEAAVKRVAQETEDRARRQVPTLTGAARSSLRLELTGDQAELRAGGSRAPYFGWLDFGGSVGRGESVSRPYRSAGRFIYHELGRQDEEATLKESLDAALSDAGLEVR